MDTIPDIFNSFGGIANVAKILGVRYSAASEMKRRPSIPVRYWHTLLGNEKAAEVGLTQDLLIRVHSVKPKARKAKARKLTTQKVVVRRATA